MFDALSQSSLMLVLLGASSLILYLAGRTSLSAIPARVDGASLRAWLAAVPVVIVSLVTVALGRPLVGLHLPVACATAALTFAIGVVLIGRRAPADATGSRSWAMVLPAVSILGVAVIGGTLDWRVSILLIVYGSLALAGWRPDTRPATDGEAIPPQASRRKSFIAVATWTAAAVAATVSGVLAVVGLPALESLRQVPSDALATVFLLAPAIVLPMTFELLPPCRSIGWAASISSLAKFALICLCVALPFAAIAAAARPAFAPQLDVVAKRRPATQPVTTAPVTPTLFPTTRESSESSELPPATAPATTMPVHVPSAPAFVMKYVSLPSVPQRADLFVLAGAALLLLPLGAGILRAGRLEAVGLIGCYLFYLLLVMAMVVR